LSRKGYALAGLLVIGLAILFSLASFLRENWGADQVPSAFERLVARWFLSGARAAQQDQVNPFPPTPENLQAGADLYRNYCAFCHGADGTGSGETGIQFYPPVPSLVESNAELSDAQVHAIISRGIRYTAMPSFANALTTEEIWKVTAWVRQVPGSAGNADSDNSANRP
jgi:mono/diheme cytochrome c family protein